MPASRGAHRDLLGAVGVAVEPGLADQELAAARRAWLRDGLDRCAQRGDVACARSAARAARRRSARGTRRTPRAGDSPHSPVVTPALAQAIEAGMMLRPSPRRAPASSAQGRRDRASVARGAPGLQALDLLRLDGSGDGHEAAVVAGRQRRGLALGEAVDADHDLLAGFDRREPRARSIRPGRCFM